MIKLLMSWDIKPGQEAAYFEFVVKEFLPGQMKLGLQPTEAWYTIQGNGPQMLTGAVTEDLETMRRILQSEDWRRLLERLLAYVVNYRQKIVRASGRFQI